MRSMTFLPLLLIAFSSTVSAQQLVVHHIDVDQGDATLFVMPNGSTMLIDAGLDGRGAVIADYLSNLGIVELDAFVLTHYDSDHMGGIDKLVGRGVVVNSWFDRGGWDSADSCSPNTSQFCQYSNTARIATALHPGWMIDLDPDVTIRVVASNGRVGMLSPYPDPTEENALSVTLVVSYRGFNYLIGGDLTSEVEERLLREAAVGDVDVYHVNHHGSETSSSRAFLEQVSPEVAIISAGSHCGYHHPRRAVLEALRVISGIDIYQTNRYLCGDSRGDNQPDEFIGDLDQVGAEGSIVISVGQSDYTVSVVSSGRERTYPIERP